MVVVALSPGSPFIFTQISNLSLIPSGCPVVFLFQLTDFYLNGVYDCLVQAAAITGALVEEAATISDLIHRKVALPSGIVEIYISEVSCDTSDWPAVVVSHSDAHLLLHAVYHLHTLLVQHNKTYIEQSYYMHHSDCTCPH